MNNFCADQCDCCKEIWNKDNLKMIAIGEHKMAFCPDCFTEYQKTKPDTESIVNEIRELAKFHSVEVPIQYGDGTNAVDKMLPLEELDVILSELAEYAEESKMDTLQVEESEIGCKEHPREIEEERDI